MLCVQDSYEELPQPADKLFETSERYCTGWPQQRRFMKIYKVAGLSLLGFCIASLGLQHADLGPIASQAGAFCGAFLGGVTAHWPKRSDRKPRAESAGERK
jgi:hypothetical protein